MGYKKDLGEDFFIKNLIEEMKTREITDEEQERIEELFVEAYGYLPTNLCLSPHRLRRKWQQLEEGEAVEEWYEKDDMAYFENTPIKIKNKDISLMCKEPKLCYSHSEYGFACKCIRENFATPTEFRLWAKNELNELKDELQAFTQKNKKFNR